MKNKLLLFLVFSFAWASGAVVTEAELAALYDETNVQVYAEHRDCIASAEENRQVLVRLSMDHTIPWHVSLMANVCLERMEKAEEQDRFEVYDWNSDPEYDPDWICSAAGYPMELIPLFHKRLSEHGLWYRYLEHYLGKMPTDSGIMRHIGNVLLENSVETPRHFAALIANEHAKTDLAEPISWRPDALYHLKSYILDGTFPEGILTILPYKSAYFSLNADERAKAIEYIRDPVLVEHWFEFYRANGRYDSALHKRLEALRKESEDGSNPIEQEGSFIDDRTRELRNAASTNQLPVSQTLAAGDASGSKTAASPAPGPEGEPPSSSTRSVFRMVLLFALGFVLGIAFTRLWLSRKAMA